MGKIIRVTPEELGSVSEKLNQLSEEYTTVYTKLLQDASTMGTAWEGEDNQAFVSQITGFTEELKAMAEKLASVASALDVQRQNYVNRQQDNITQVKKLTN